MKLAYTDDAIEGLQRLREFIAIHNPLAAARVANELVSKIGLLPGFPELGSPVGIAPMPNSIRDRFFGKYVVRYSVHTSYHYHSSDMARAWGER